MTIERSVPDLESILGELAPEVIAHKVALHYDLARERFQVKRPTVASYEEFRRQLAGFYNYLFCAANGQQGPLPDIHALNQAWQIIESSHQDGIEGAYYDARTGVNGGLIGVFNHIYEKMRADAEKQHITYLLRTRVSPFEFHDQVELCRQYLARYGQNLPPGVAPRDPEDLARNWQELVVTLAQILGSHRRNVGRAP